MKIYADLGGATSRRFATAFAAGYRGMKPASIHYGNIWAGNDDSAFFLSPDIWDMYNTARQCGHNYYYADHAYFGRGQRFRITRNAKQHHGGGEGDKTRFAELNVTIKEWRKSGTHILICPNSETFFKLNGTTFYRWYEDVEAQLAKVTDRPLKLRWKVDAAANPIANDLIDCHACIVYTSNSAVDALMGGVPTFTTEQCAATRMSRNDLSSIESPYFPEDRYQFACALAANQWTLEEIQQGDAWRAIGHD